MTYRRIDYLSKSYIAATFGINLPSPSAPASRWTIGVPLQTTSAGPSTLGPLDPECIQICDVFPKGLVLSEECVNELCAS